MAGIGKLTAAFLSASNENTIALANANFDFSIVKFEAPKEFHAFGASLSRQRRSEAEDGSIHKTARRLGALFESQVPATPRLIKAYGTRTSEIASSPDVNPKGTSRHGPFEAYIGADGTSIWAAATSSKDDEKGHPPLAMHLLACMLARAFKSEQAISIWVELVRTRQYQIDNNVDLEPQPIAAVLASRQDIGRDHLALWDASARSWLRAADEAKKVQRTQLQLVVDNLSLQFATRESTYEAVIHIWRNAMICIENCLKGSPQQVSDGSILLALSSWHLYPDLIVAHEVTTKVPFNDHLLKASGALTIGLELAPGSRPAGVHWSLTLSHLKYYGNAIKVQSSSDVQRFTMDQILVILFGDLMSSWGILNDVEEQRYCAQWLIELSDALDLHHQSPLQKQNEQYGWIRLLAVSGLKYLEMYYNEPQQCSMLVRWGRRRARKFFGSSQHAPFFQLNDPLLTSALSKTDPLEAGISYYRSLAEQMNLRPGEAVIRSIVNLVRGERIELVTAVPHTRKRSKRSRDGTCVSEEVHCRWVGFVAGTSQGIFDSACSCQICDASCPCAVKYGGLCRVTCHHGSHSDRCMTVGGWTSTRYDIVTTQLRENCCILPDQSITDRGVPIARQSSGDDSIHPRDFSLKGLFAWNRPPVMFHNHSEPTSPDDPCASLSNEVATCICFDAYKQPTNCYHDAYFKLIRGSTASLGLFVRTWPLARDAPSRYRSHQVSATKALTHRATPSESIQALRLIKKSKIHLLREFMSYKARAQIHSHGNIEKYEFEALASTLGVLYLPFEYLKSLSLLGIARELYEDLAGATIPTDILKTALHEAKWLTHDWVELEPLKSSGSVLLRTSFSRRDGPNTTLVSYINYPGQSLGRAESFACIATFESGAYNVDALSCLLVIALASANSIFVSEKLLSDPATPGEGRVIRVVGNFGRSGISMLVLPQEPPLVRPLGDDWRAVPHRPYDKSREDNLRGTTLVLSFTEWKRPLPVLEQGTIDDGLNFVEGVVSVHDRGTWVADIDLTDLHSSFLILECCCDFISSRADVEITSIDSWEELLDAPDNIGVVRSRGNWAARLATAAVRRQQGHDGLTYIVPPDSNPCWECFGKVFLRPYNQVIRSSPDTKVGMTDSGGIVGVIID